LRWLKGLTLTLKAVYQYSALLNKLRRSEEGVTMSNEYRIEAAGHAFILIDPAGERVDTYTAM
jgi:hypothetical protein